MEEKKKSNGCLLAFIITFIIAIVIGAIIGIAIVATKNSRQQHEYILRGDGGDNDDNTNYEPSTPQIFTRNATLNDITVTGHDVDFSSLGEKLTFIPKHDIDGLEFTFRFYKSSGETLQTITKYMGDVVEGRQYSLTISVTELSWEVYKNIFSCESSYRISSGTISVFS